MDKRERVGKHRSASLGISHRIAASLPANDEVLSSYLVRRAHRHGLSPHRFVRRQFAGAEVWTRDIDSSLGVDLLSKIASSLSLGEATVRSMTLYGLVGASSPADEKWRDCRSWVNSVGVYHRMRTNFGLQYCPVCLQTEPLFLRHWRLCCAFVCPQHGVFLQDCCVSCGAPIILHRNKISIDRCWKCGSSLCIVSSQRPPVTADVLSLQSHLMSCIDSYMVSVGSVLVPREHFVRGATIIMRILKEYIRRHACQWMCSGSSEALRFELRLLRAPERLRLFEMLMELLDDWPANFLQFAWSANVTQIAVNRCGNVPEWVGTAVKQLRVRSHLRQSSEKATFVRYVQRVEKIDGTKCRSRRAQALMLAAKGKYGN